jgi:hypothetical protein
VPSCGCFLMYFFGLLHDETTWVASSFVKDSYGCLLQASLVAGLLG